MAFLASDEIHLLLIDEASIEEKLLALYPPLLSPHELERCARFYRAEDRRRFLITRAAIRTALTHYIPEISPTAWQFTRNAHGRPAVAETLLAAAPTFNISHTEGLIVIALAGAGELGVDVEDVSRRSRTQDVAERYFSQVEVRELLTLSEHEQRIRFFDLWTLKEAWIKALGVGLAMPLDSFSFCLSGAGAGIRFAAERDHDPARWQFWQLRPSAQHQIAIAYAAENGQSKMKMLVSNMIPMRSITASELLPFRTSQRIYSSTTFEP